MGDSPNPEKPSKSQPHMNLKSTATLLSALALATMLASGCCAERKACCSTTAQAKSPAPALTPLPPPLPAPASQDDTMAWSREAKYGLFIHWGLYCIPAGEWQGKPIPGIGEWIMNRGQ